MIAQDNVSNGKALVLDERPFNPTNTQYHRGSSFGGSFNFGGSYNSVNRNNNSGGYKGQNFRGRARSRNHFGNNLQFFGYNLNNTPGILGLARPHVFTCLEHSNDIPICQICNKRGPIAADCCQRHSSNIVSSSLVQY